MYCIALVFSHTAPNLTGIATATKDPLLHTTVVGTNILKNKNTNNKPRQHANTVTGMTYN